MELHCHLMKSVKRYSGKVNFGSTGASLIQQSVFRQTEIILNGEAGYINERETIYGGGLSKTTKC